MKFGFVVGLELKFCVYSCVNYVRENIWIVTLRCKIHAKVYMFIRYDPVLLCCVSILYPFILGGTVEEDDSGYGGSNTRFPPGGAEEGRI